VIEMGSYGDNFGSNYQLAASGPAADAVNLELGDFTVRVD
jgi:hypothetical protein